MRRIQTGFVLVTAMALTATIAGCTSSSGSGSSGSSPKSSTSGAKYTYTSNGANVSTVDGVNLASSLGAMPAAHHERIAVILKSLTNQYWQGIESGVKAAASKFGVDVTVQAASSESAQTEQLTIAQTLISQKYDAYIVAPESTSNLTPALAQIEAQGAPVVNVDDARVAATVYVGPDHSLDGKGAAEFLAQHLPKGAEVAQVEGQAGSSAAILRIAGFKAGVAQTGLNMVASVPGNWDTNQAYADTQQILAQHPNVKGIYANNDTMAVGVAKAITDAGKSGSILVVGTDGIPQALSDIRGGTMAATLSPLPYYEGYWAVESAVRLLGGQQVPQWVKAPAQLITKSNADQYYNAQGDVKTGLYQ